MSLGDLMSPPSDDDDRERWACLTSRRRAAFMRLNVILRSGGLAGSRAGLMVVNVEGAELALLFLVVDGNDAHRGPLANGENQSLSLTVREREICALLARGFSGPAIAQMLGIAPSTVQAHVRNAMAKYGTGTRTGLVAAAMADGFVRA